jgi:uncharacterized protein
MNISRRDFVKGIALAPVALAAGGAVGGPGGSTRLTTFPYSAVKLLDGPLQRQYDMTHRLFLRLDENRLLKVYRKRAGLPAPGEDMGGWYEADGLTPGGSLGQYISALARFASAAEHSATPDTSPARSPSRPAELGDLSGATRDKVGRLVRGFAETMARNGNPYAVEPRALRNPAYILDKLTVGLLDATRLAAVPGCLDVLRRAWDFGLKLLLPRPVEIFDPAIGGQPDELYTLPENLYYAYELTGEQRYRELARRYLFDEYFDPLSRGEDALTGRHAYSHVNALGSAARAYLVDGDGKYLRAAQNAFDRIEAQEYASGGYGPNETFVKPGADALFESLTATDRHFETPCCAYAHFKLIRYLMCITGQSRYGDSMERILYNTILGAKDIQEDGRTFYYADYRISATKRYYYSPWPCCSGTYAQVIADYGISAYFRDRGGIYVNLYVPSELHWKGNEAVVTLIQNTRYPLDDRSTITVRTPVQQEFTVALRIPGWAEQAVRIAVNGKDADVETKPGQFAVVKRKWKDGDEIVIRFPMVLRTVPINEQHPKVVALMRGPVMYVSSNPGVRLPASAELAKMSPVADPVKPGRFELPGVRTVEGRATFAPYFAIEDEAYTTYLAQT